MKTTAGTFGAVLRHVTTHYEISAKQILGDGRRSTITEARWFCCWLMRQHGFSYPLIARLIDKDHSSVLHAVRMLDKRRAADVHMNGRLLQLQRAINMELAPRAPEIVSNGWGLVCGEVGYSFGETVGCVSHGTVPA